MLSLSLFIGYVESCRYLQNYAIPKVMMIFAS